MNATIRQPACSCEFIKGNLVEPCLVHVRWMRQRMRPAIDLLKIALPETKSDRDAAEWTAQRDRLIKVIEP